MLLGCSGEAQTLLGGIELSQQTVDFGATPLGSVIEQQVLIKNLSTQPLQLERLELNQPGEAFAYGLNTPQINGNSFARLTIRFQPEQLGAHNASLAITTQDTTTTLELTGTGDASAPLTLEPSALDFGNVVIGTSKTLPLVLSNASDVPARVDLFLEPPFYARVRDGTVNVDGSFELLGGASVQIDVRFEPTVATTEQAAINFGSCPTSACSVSAELRGVGVEQGIVCAPALLDMGTVSPGACVERPVTCTNTANTRVEITSWSLEPNESFQVAPVAPQHLDAGESLDILVSYCPQQLGFSEGTLRIDTDEPRSLFVQLQGQAGGPDLAPTIECLDFGLTSLIAPTRRSLTLTNTGFEAAQINTVFIDGRDAFSLTPQSPRSGAVEPGSFITFTVEFAPAAEGVIEAELVVLSDDADRPELRIKLSGEGVALEPCSYVLSPPQLSFGTVQVGQLQHRGVEVQNTGPASCLLFARVAPGSDPEFTLAPLQNAVLSPGASAALRVAFSPLTVGQHTGALELSISDPANPFVNIPLSAESTSQGPLITPGEVDFGTVGLMCSTRARSVRVFNTSATTLRIDSINVFGDAFSLFDVGTALPTNLAPGASLDLSVSFHAARARASDYAGAVELLGELGGAPVLYTVDLRGRSDPSGEQTDRFQQLSSSKSDILFVVNSSPSASSERQALATSFPAMAQRAQALGLDYQLGVVSSDVEDSAQSGRLLGSPAIITPQTPAADQAFHQRLTLSSFAQPQGLQAMYLALSNPLITTNNAGFLRQDASLGLIFLSDVEDTSPGSVEFFVNFFRGLKHSSAAVSAVAIVGDIPAGCTGAEDSASPAPRYTEFTAQLGGQVMSICGSWAQSMPQLFSAAAGLKDRFELTAQPVVSTIEIEIDGLAMPATAPGGIINWSYDFPTNTVRLTTAPPPGANIEIIYVSECF